MTALSEQKRESSEIASPSVILGILGRNRCHTRSDDDLGRYACSPTPLFATIEEDVIDIIHRYWDLTPTSSFVGQAKLGHQHYEFVTTGIGDIDWRFVAISSDKILGSYYPSIAIDPLASIIANVDGPIVRKLVPNPLQKHYRFISRVYPSDVTGPNHGFDIGIWRAE